MISLEVAEHLSLSRASGFIDDLTNLSNVVLFSAAILMQGGVHHINEQPINYWANLFLERGFVPMSCIRLKYWSCLNAADLEGVDIAYANNIVVYINQDKLSEYGINPQEYIDNFSTISNYTKASSC